MAEQNVLTGDIHILEQIANDVNEHKETVERLNKLTQSLEDINKNLQAAQQAVDNEVESRVKDSMAAISSGYDKSIASDKDRLKEVQTKRERAKTAGVKERIANETADIRKENELLKNQMKDMLAKENLPSICSNRLYLALFRTQKVTDVCIYLLCLAFVYAAIPFLISFIPDFPLWGMIVYYVCMVLLQSFAGKLIVEKTVIKHVQVIDGARDIKRQITANKRKVKKISKNIRTDKNEDMYELSHFDEKIEKIRSDISDIEKEKEKALDDFENTVKKDIIAEIRGREQGHIDAMRAEADKKSSEKLRLENLIKEQRIYISSNYEAYLGKEYVTEERLIQLKQIMASGEADTVSKALAIYREKYL